MSLIIDLHTPDSGSKSQRSCRKALSGMMMGGRVESTERTPCSELRRFGQGSDDRRTDCTPQIITLSLLDLLYSGIDFWQMPSLPLILIAYTYSIFQTFPQAPPRNRQQYQLALHPSWTGLVPPNCPHLVEGCR